MNLAGVNGSIAVSKTEGRGSNPWRGAKYLFLLLAFVSSFSFAHEKKRKIKPAVRTDNISYLVYNNTKNVNEYTRNIDTIRPIASVTKLMTAMVTLNYDLNMSRHLKINSKVGGTLPRNRSYTREELLNAMLVRSDNSAAETLANDYPGGRKAFIQEMNRFSVYNSMVNTNFEDPTGLSSSNTSNAADVALMIAKAAQYTFIREISTKKQIEIDTYYKNKTRKLVLNNTNRPILFGFEDIVVSKTGFTSAAGFCLGLAVERNGQRYSVVILGTNNVQARIAKAQDILNNHITTEEQKDIDK